jgi:hypothetical protein
MLLKVGDRTVGHRGWGSAEWLTTCSDRWSSALCSGALLASVLVAVICGILGSFVVLKGLAFIGDALAHASFGGWPWRSC